MNRRSLGSKERWEALGKARAAAVATKPAVVSETVVAKAKTSVASEAKPIVAVSPLFKLPALINQFAHVETLLDDGCSAYGIISDRTARRLNLKRIPLPQPVRSFNFEAETAPFQEVAILETLDVGGNVTRDAHVYIAKRMGNVELILGKPWRAMEHAYVDDTDTLHFRVSGVKVANPALEKELATQKAKMIRAAAYMRHARKDKEAQVFAASLEDITRALKGKEKVDPKDLLPEELWEFLPVFDRSIADTLPSHRAGVDHEVELIKQPDGTDPEIPWGPLYGMSAEELLVLRKTLTEHLNKGFIRASSSPAGAPVLFVKKPGGGLRFCVDYRALNDLTKKDRYPLPLIKETLRKVSKAQWFTKLDIIAAFNRIRIKEGQEWMTAFRTRLGLFEWLVMPFGMANAPSTFQRYVNHVLQEYLDDFVSAYVDDILIYTDGTLSEHKEHVRLVLAKLRDAGLQVDIEKCAFYVKSTTYLGFVITAGRGISMDQKKISTIQEWAPPSSAKGVRSFLGFANFYHDFIAGFSTIAAPLHKLLTKAMLSQPFVLTPEAQSAFQTLKARFISAPSLAFHDFDKETKVQCDASGWNTGAVLLQRANEHDAWKPVAFTSQRMNSHEVNYAIHDKEMLAVVHALKEWRELLRAGPFTIETDHKNLEYFKTKRSLNERQTRWAQLLSEFNFTLVYRPGKENVLADALSRREQDLPKGADDSRLSERKATLIPPEKIAVEASAVTLEPPSELVSQWQSAKEQDSLFQDLVRAVRAGDRQLPVEHRHLKISMNDLTLVETPQDSLQWRARLWVPDNEPLRTGLLQLLHDAPLQGHPGKNALYAMTSRKYFWPGLSRDVARFVRNCRLCSRANVWRELRAGMLQPMPIAETPWSEIAMDYITTLPTTRSLNRHLLVIVDRLTKQAILAPVPDVSGATLARALLRYVVAYHGLPAAITSDRGDQFVKGVWGEVCNILGIKKRLSSGYHPQTDGSTERMNAEVERYWRLYCNEHQDNWDELAPIAQLALANRESTALGMSPFFMTHGRQPLDIADVVTPDIPTDRKLSPKEAAAAFVKRMQEAWSFAQASIANAQQQQERNYNQRHAPSPRYAVGDKVWLDVRDFTIAAPRTRKLAALHRQYEVTELVGPSAVRLNVPGHAHPVFHHSLLKLVANDPLPSQQVSDTQPEAVLKGADDDEEPEWLVEKILDHRVRRVGRGGVREFLVKWVGYEDSTWENEENVEHCEALDAYEARLGFPIAGEPLNLPARGRGRRGVL